MFSPFFTLFLISVEEISIYGVVTENTILEYLSLISFILSSRREYSIPTLLATINLLSLNSSSEFFHLSIFIKESAQIIKNISDFGYLFLKYLIVSIV